MVSGITSSFANRRDNLPIVSKLSYYGAVRGMIELDYLGEKKVVLFDCGWVSKGKRLKQDDDGFTLTNFTNVKRHNEPFILASQAKQVFYVEDPVENTWRVVLKIVARDRYDMEERSELDMEQWGTIHSSRENEEVVLVTDDVVGTKVDMPMSNPWMARTRNFRRTYGLPDVNKQEVVLVHHQESPRSDGSLHEHTNKNKTRGCTFCPTVWGLPPAVKLSIKLIKRGQSIGDNNSQFTTFLGNLAKIGMYCPIDILDWLKMPKSNKKELLGIVQSKFIEIHGMDEWILQSIGEKWRHWKQRLKDKNDIFSKANGPEKAGRLCTYGHGVTPTDLFEEIPSRRACFRMIQTLKERLDTVELRTTQQNMNDISSPVDSGLPSSCSNEQRIPTLEINNHYELIFSVALLSIVDRKEIVAKGFLKSMEPSNQVGGQVLGKNYCEVHVNVVVKRDEELIRPNDSFETMRDVLGMSISWPISLVVRDES
ncbi:hypothetical protein BUALT_Bualt12G0069400 [Buddleja alternifolia]|uniref:Transposase Tnp1/En/Spm-like domain-containing protein n=1 Tax=Buddleja alternifolia TaxID=168488 RepID=A0AAV6WXB0_9LAMI|nr:hypothetical protein BUALT_Bualt12G0069400 [Buddleja alternifolia]